MDPLSEDRTRNLKNNRVALAEKIDLNIEVWDLLRQDRVVTRAVRETIEVKSSTTTILYQYIYRLFL